MIFLSPDRHGLDTVIQTNTAKPGFYCNNSGMGDELAIKALHEGAQDYR
jgi:hypothetical protein